MTYSFIVASLLNMLFAIVVLGVVYWVAVKFGVPKQASKRVLAAAVMLLALVSSAAFFNVRSPIYF